jgi:hypothetical protein
MIIRGLGRGLSDQTTKVGGNIMGTTQPQFPINIGYEDKYIQQSVHTTFLGLQIDSHLNWKTHVDQLVLKLSGTCYAVRSLSHINKISTLKFFILPTLLLNEIWNNFLGKFM